MDLGACLNIEELDVIAKANGIEIPRLRGYRLMKDENPVSKAEMKEMLESMSVYIAENLCEATPFWSAHLDWYSVEPRTNYIKKYFLVKGEDGFLKVFVGIGFTAGKEEF